MINANVSSNQNTSNNSKGACRNISFSWAEYVFTECITEKNPHEMVFTTEMVNLNESAWPFSYTCTISVTPDNTSAIARTDINANASTDNSAIATASATANASANGNASANYAYYYDG